MAEKVKKPPITVKQFDAEVQRGVDALGPYKYEHDGKLYRKGGGTEESDRRRLEYKVGEKYDHTRESLVEAWGVYNLSQEVAKAEAWKRHLRTRRTGSWRPSTLRTTFSGIEEPASIFRRTLGGM